MRKIASAAAALLVLVLAGCGAQAAAPVTVTTTATVTVTASPSAAAQAAAETFEMTGSMEIYGDGNHFTEQGASCSGTGGYSDLGVGASVTVYNAEGKIVGVGEIEQADYAAGLCTMHWTVEDVPAGQGPYQYEISHRGRLTVSESEARSGNASASIGN